MKVTRARSLLVLGLGLGACGRIGSDVGAVFDAGNGTATQAGQSGGGSGATAPAAQALGVDLEGAPIYTRFQRLTNAQWQRAVTDILALPASVDVGGDLPPPAQGKADFSNNERILYVDRPTADAYERAAEAAAALATSSSDALSAVYSGNDRDGFVSSLGRRAFRRPLTPEEQQSYARIFDRGEELYGSGFARGAALVIRALLQSPHFLYRSEIGPAGEPLSSYELASKLSFWLLGTTPSDALLDAAAPGMLDTPEALAAVAVEMLKQPGAATVMRDFHGQLYGLERYERLPKVADVESSEAFNAELAEVSLRFFDRVFVEDQGLRGILTSTRGFVGPLTAASYTGQSAPAAVEERELGSARPGYFTQVPFLVLGGVNREPNSIRRGAEILARVLCSGLAPPAEDLPAPPGFRADQTNRQRVTELTAGCGDRCHREYIDPLGFAFEAYDGLGMLRESDQGQPIDSSGSYPLSDGAAKFENAGELLKSLADSSEAHLCYSKKLTGFALQRDVVSDDRDLLDALAAASRLGSLSETILTLVRSPAFRLRSEAAP